MEDVIIIQVDSNSLSDYLNMIMNADIRGTLVQLCKASRFGYVFLRRVQLSFYSGVNVN